MDCHIAIAATAMPLIQIIRHAYRTQVFAKDTNLYDITAAHPPINSARWQGVHSYKSLVHRCHV